MAEIPKVDTCAASAWGCVVQTWSFLKTTKLTVDCWVVCALFALIVKDIGTDFTSKAFCKLAKGLHLNIWDKWTDVWFTHHSDAATFRPCSFSRRVTQKARLRRTTKHHLEAPLSWSADIDEAHLSNRTKICVTEASDAQVWQHLCQSFGTVSWKPAKPDCILWNRLTMYSGTAWQCTLEQLRFLDNYGFCQSSLMCPFGMSWVVPIPYRLDANHFPTYFLDVAQNDS